MTSSANETQRLQRHATRLLLALAAVDGIAYDDIPMDLAADVRVLIAEIEARRANRGGNKKRTAPAD